jgi:rRNA maturation RNase YbeY
LHRVMVHGLLHLCGYKDKTPSQAKTMRAAENAMLLLRTSHLP